MDRLNNLVSYFCSKIYLQTSSFYLKKNLFFNELMLLELGVLRPEPFGHGWRLGEVVHGEDHADRRGGGGHRMSLLLLLKPFVSSMYIMSTLAIILVTATQQLANFFMYSIYIYI